MYSHSTEVKNEEPNLFEFHFNTPSSPLHTHQNTIDPPFIKLSHHSPQSNNFYSYFSDNTPTSYPKQEGASFSSPQLKPKPYQPRKRFKTIAASNYSLSPKGNQGPPENESQKEDNDDDDDDDDEDEDDEENDSETRSNGGSVGSNNMKRGKYKVYTEAEKATILNFMMKHGMQKTLEIFSNNTHRITKRKLKSWVEGQYKIKGVKGRKTNDPNRDQALYDWCVQFQLEQGKAPTRKEATKKALELSEDPTFQASKGWLDKFSRKYNIEFTPLKVIPSKNKKKIEGFPDGDSNSTVSNSDTSSVDGMSPLMRAMQNIQPFQQQTPLKQWNLESNNLQNESLNNFEYDGFQVNDFFNFGNNSESNTQNTQSKGFASFEQALYHQQPQQMDTQISYPKQHSFFSYQPNFEVNFQPQMNGMQQIDFNSNQQIQIEPGSFLNFGNNQQQQQHHHHGNFHGNPETKMEYPY